MKNLILVLSLFTSIYHANYARIGSMPYPFHQYNLMNVYNPILYHNTNLTHQPTRCTVMQSNGKTIIVESEWTCKGK